MLHSHVDESVLGLGLHHPRPLGSDHLDGLWHVDVAVHPCGPAEGSLSLKVGRSIGGLTLFSDDVDQDVDDYEGSGPPDPCAGGTQVLTRL